MDCVLCTLWTWNHWILSCSLIYSSNQPNGHSQLISKWHLTFLLSQWTWSDWFDDLVSVFMWGQHPVSVSHHAENISPLGEVHVICAQFMINNHRWSETTRTTVLLKSKETTSDQSGQRWGKLKEDVCWWGWRDATRISQKLSEVCFKTLYNYLQILSVFETFLKIIQFASGFAEDKKESNCLI